MIFYNDLKDLVVISKKTNKPIAHFKNGEFETHDPEVIAKMQLHFKNDGIDFKKLHYWKLVKFAEKYNIENHKKKKSILVEKLEELQRRGEIYDDTQSGVDRKSK